MMKSGTYYIGDLCYVMKEEWDEFCDLAFVDGKPVTGEFSLKDGRKFAYHNTAFGDGIYETNIGTDLPVDAGLIGCIHMDDIDLNNSSNNLDMGDIVEFEEDFQVEEFNGTITFGPYEVDTRMGL
jgi:hypothetical protein